MLVRVSRLLLFDSEHFINNHLVRVNSWEIHPALKLEFCTQGNTCKANSNAGWKSLDDVPALVNGEELGELIRARRPRSRDDRWGITVPTGTAKMEIPDNMGAMDEHSR